MISTSSLIRSTGILFGVLSVSIFGMGVWFDSLQVAAEVTPIVSLRWMDGNGSDVIDVIPPTVVFDGKEILAESGAQTPSLDDQLYWIENRLLEEDIEEQNISNETITLDYIDFFAGVDVSSYRYAAYRLLRQKNMFVLSDRDYEEEIAYLFADIPINIQGRSGERLLTTNQEIVDWKTEVLEQQSFVERLKQYLVKRRFEEQTRIVVQISSPVLELRLQSDWKGWVLVSGLFTMEGCSSIAFKQHSFQDNDGAIHIALPFWELTDEDCRRQYFDSGLTSLKVLDIKTTKDDGYMNPITTVWRMSNKICKYTSREMISECTD